MEWLEFLRAHPAQWENFKAWLTSIDNSCRDNYDSVSAHEEFLRIQGARRLWQQIVAQCLAAELDEASEREFAALKEEDNAPAQ